MTQVRRGRKEERILRNDAESQRPSPPHGTYAIRLGGRTDDQALLKGVGLGHHDLRMLITVLHRSLYSDDIAEDDWWRRLYDPALSDIRSLPAAILDDKELLPPAEFLPRTRDALRLWLKGLMLRNGPRDNNLDLLIEGWAEGLSPGKAFNQHLEDLWRLHGRGDKSLYYALVGGRFGPVIRELRACDQLMRHDLRRILIRQSLIWCAHDVQMLLARLHRLVSFGLLAKTGAAPTPERVLNQMRDRRVVLAAALDAFFETDAWRTHEVDPPDSNTRADLRRHPNKLIRRQSKYLAKRFGGQEPVWMSGDLATLLMKQIAAALRDKTDLMLARSAEERTTQKEARSFTREWYNVASVLTAGAVVIRRLIQAESAMAQMINQRTTPVDFLTSLREGWALPAYPEFLPRGADSRLDSLLNFYREALFDDPETEDDSKHWQRRSIKAKKASHDFLVERGERLIHHHHGAEDALERSLYLLDVIPEHRFCMG